jgi:hypothetical protein
MFKKLNSPIFLALLGLGVVLFSVSVPSTAQPMDHFATTICWLSAEQPKTDNGSASSDPETATFTGRIMKSGSNLVLEDADNKVTYLLDDQEKAKSFEGKSVKVTGQLDVATNTIHIAEIEPVA